MKRILLFVFLLSTQLLAFGQTKERLPCVDKKFSVVVHIVMDYLPSAGITEAQILQNIVLLNAKFAPICVSFEVCEFRYIHNSYYDTIKNKNWDEMQILYNVKNRINVYYVTEITLPGSGGEAGFAGLGAIANLQSDGIVLKKTSSLKTLYHEAGHYFGLQHTFETSNGLELVNGSNCLTAGDKICDTPADPNGSVDPNNCQFLSTQKDANGQYYNPIVGNIMSYYPDNCACDFTHDQYIKMAKTYLALTGMW